MRIRLDLSYKGTNYFGWQKQPDKPSIQQEIETAILKLFNTEVKTQGSGRTDAGTHAYHQVVDFQIDQPIEHFDIFRGLNRHLPKDIRVTNVFLVPDEFNSLKTAISKTYLYKINNDTYACPLKAELTHWVSNPLDLDYLNKITQPLIGMHDFSSFQTTGTPLFTTVREIYSAEWSKGPESEVWFKINGSGFLKQMVRNIVGTLLDGHWKQQHSPESILKILESKSRPSAGSTAPAQGLYLYEVKYPSDLDKKCLKS
jgi:tRNA pseudouridine38-40 synthase